MIVVGQARQRNNFWINNAAESIDYSQSIKPAYWFCTPFSVPQALFRKSLSSRRSQTPQQQQNVPPMRLVPRCLNSLFKCNASRPTVGHFVLSWHLRSFSANGFQPGTPRTRRGGTFCSRCGENNGKGDATVSRSSKPRACWKTWNNNRTQKRKNPLD